MSESGQTPHITCDTFESTLGDYLEGGLTEHERELSQRHLAGCAQCTALVADLDHIVHAAAALPPLAPSRDLWPEIEARLGADVLAMPAHRASTVQSRNISWRAMAAAAALLVTASAGITWTLARNTPATVEVPALAVNSDTVRGNAAGAGQATGNSSAGLNPAGDSVNEGIDVPSTDQITLPAERLVVSNNNAALTQGSPSRKSSAVPSAAPTVTSTQSGNTAAPELIAVANTERMMALDTLYGREISRLRTVAESQLGMLDSSTVNVVRRNLDIIDKAILESRAALESDPNSGFLLEQLDRAYERKVDLLRRLAFL